MASEQDTESASDLQREIRLGRAFSLADVIGREGSDFMKGESPIPPLVQAMTQINLFIDEHLRDPTGILQTVLQAWVKAEAPRVSRHLNSPMVALQTLLEDILSQPATLYELVRQTDVQWGQTFDERPHFQQPGQAPHPEDEYTHESVRAALIVLLAAVKRAQ